MTISIWLLEEHFPSILCTPSRPPASFGVMAGQSVLPGLPYWFYRKHGVPSRRSSLSPHCKQPVQLNIVHVHVQIRHLHYLHWTWAHVCISNFCCCILTALGIAASSCTKFQGSRLSGFWKILFALCICLWDLFLSFNVEVVNILGYWFEFILCFCYVVKQINITNVLSSKDAEACRQNCHWAIRDQAWDGA